MRLVKVVTSDNLDEQVQATAFSLGVQKVSRHEIISVFAGGREEKRRVVEFEGSTSTAKRFVDALLAADFYDPQKIEFDTRVPRSFISDASVREITRPLVEPASDLYLELWQFSHITFGLIGRNLIAAGLLAYGLIGSKLLFIVAGLLFVPILPMVMAIAYGIVGRRWDLFAQGLKASALTTVELFAGGLIVASVTRPPIQFEDFGSIGLGAVVSVAVGIAGGLAAIDDSGRREMIGLAAASQLALVPVWLGAIMIFGVPPADGSGIIVSRILSFAVNIIVLASTLMIVQYLTGIIGNIHRVKTDAA